MFKQTIVGTPLQCINRTCKASFYRESHLGYYPKNEVEVYAILKCPKCKDTFAVRQTYSMVFDYKNALPKNVTATPSPITKTEMVNFRKKLEQKDSLKNLYEGLKPNGSVIEDDIEKK